MGVRMEVEELFNVKVRNPRFSPDWCGMMMLRMYNIRARSCSSLEVSAASFSCTIALMRD